MNQNQIILLLSAAALLLYLFYTIKVRCNPERPHNIKKRPAALLAFVGRGAAGLSYLYLFNYFCAVRGVSTGLGMNLITAGLAVFLGIPGALLAFGVNLLRFL